MGKTANYNLPFPEATDKANVPLDIQKLAEAAESAFGNKVNSEIGKRLMTDAEGNKLASLKNYDDSELIKLIDSQNIDIRYLEKQVERLLKDHKPIPFNAVSSHLVDTGELPMPISINGGIEQDGEPSIENPVEVKGVSGHYDNYVSDNFFDNVFRQGSVSEVGRANRLFSTQEVKVEMGKSYSILTNLDLSKYKYAVALATNVFPTNTSFYDSGWKTQKAFTFTTSNEGYFGIGIARLDDKALTPSELENVYFEVVTKYQQFPLDIPFNMYSGKPYKENGKWYRPIEWKKNEFTGNEIFSIGTSSTGLNFFNCNETFKDNGSTMLYMNYFKKISKSFSQLTEKGDYCTWGTREPNRLAIMCKDYDTIEDFTAWLKEKYNNGTPVYIVYKLATPTIEEITDTTLIAQLEALEKAHSYYEVTNINSYGSEAEMKLSGNALMSNDIRLSKLESALLSLGGI